MSKKKGLSLEEKRTKLLEIFYEKKDVFQLKELEKLGPKEKGITSMSVKDVLQSLVDDNLVDTDKIGTGVYFWAFPSKAIIARRNSLEAIEAALKETHAKIEEVKVLLAAARVGKEESEERTTLVTSYNQLKTHNEEVVEKLSKYDDMNSIVLEEIKAHTLEIKQGINRWTDNIYSLSKFCKDRLGVGNKEIEEYFGVPPDIDYV